MGTGAHARRDGEGTTVFAGALGLVERWEVVGEAGDGFLEDGEFVSAVGGRTETIEAQFPCCRRDGGQSRLEGERDSREEEEYVD